MGRIIIILEKSKGTSSFLSTLSYIDMAGNSGVDDLPIWVKEIVDDQSIACYSYSLWFNSTGLVHQRQSEITQFCTLLAKISTTKK